MADERKTELMNDDVSRSTSVMPDNNLHKYLL